MTIIQTSTLSSEQKKAVKSLQKVCFSFEKLENEPMLSSSLNFNPTIPCFFLLYEQKKLIGFLSTFFPSREEVEVNAFVHPQHRGKGGFSLLVEEARNLYKPLPFSQMLFQVEPASKSGTSYLAKHYPLIDRTEFRLTLSKNHWQEKRPSTTMAGRLIEVGAEHLDLYNKTATELLNEPMDFVGQLLNAPTRKAYLYYSEEKPIGILQKCEEENGLTMLYAIAIEENHRGKGHGKAMLVLALEKFFDTVEEISLEVDSQNPRAFNLYTSLGFEIAFRVDYHRLILP